MILYEELIRKQFAIDFGCYQYDFSENLFVTSKPGVNARHIAKGKANIVMYGNHLFIRTEDEELTNKLKKEFSNLSSEWFFEIKTINRLIELLKEYDMSIKNISPFFIPKEPIKSTAIDQFKVLREQDILAFKEDKRIKMSFGYDKNYPDRLGLAYYENNQLIGLCGASESGKYTWDLGIEILDNHYEKKGLATSLISELISLIQEENKDILPVYSTAFSHVKSMNVAIRSGCVVGWTEIFIE